MSRYITAQIQRDVVTEKRKLSTVIIAPQPVTTSDVYIQILGAERLDKLALLFYENASLWWVIAAANGLGKGTYVVPGNVRLRIPAKINIDDYVIEINRNR